MSLSPQEQALLNELQRKQAEPPAQLVPAQAPLTMIDVESRMRSMIAEYGIGSMTDRLRESIPAAPTIKPFVPPENTSTPTPPVGTEIMNRLRDIAMGALTSDQLGRVVKLGLQAGVTHGPEKAQKLLMDAGFNFLETEEGRDLIRMGVDAFFGALAKQEQKP
jgi:hypothetical protein